MSNQPIFLDVYFDLVSKISEGVYSENNPLPSERSLCSMYHVSRSTIRRAMKILREDTYIKTIHGSGNYIEPRMYYQPLTKFYSFSNTFKANGLQLKTDVISYQLIDYDYYLRSVIPDCDYTKWHKIVFISKDNNSELFLSTSYLPQNRFSTIDIDYLKGNTLSDYLSTFYNLKISRAQELLSPCLPTNEEAEILNITNKQACMILERTCYENGEIIELRRNVVRGDKYKFKIIFSNTD